MPSIGEIKSYLSTKKIEVWEFEEPTPTSQSAAQAVGCSVAEIAKTILFLIGKTPVLVVSCGDVKVNTSKLKQAAQLTGKVRLPGPDDVQHHTGYLPGGVCPFLLPSGKKILLDSSMRRFPLVYAAAGNAHSAVPITFAQLQEITGGTEVDVCQPLGT
ncbi:MAG: YbaK/EbsC family protein [Deltaproteobacteria bacterium]|nr:YbaK/EbsC family protein [Deltaproteobacteria bacterium]